MIRYQRPLKGALCLLAGILSAMSFAVGQAGYQGMSDLPASSTSYLWTALAVIFSLCFFHIFVEKKLRLRPLHIGFGLLFGAVNVMGSILFAYDSWEMGRMALLLAGLRSIGQAAPMTAVFVWLDHVLQSGVFSRRETLRLPVFCDRHFLLCCMAILIVCWSPYLIAFFPGTVCWDLGEMAAQFFGKYEMDTWHPVFTTWLFGGCMWLGRLFGSDNLGAALFTLLQTLALSYALSRAVYTLRKTGVNVLWQAGALAFFALCPIWGGYAQFISKDTLYTAALLLFTLHVLEIILKKPARFAPAELFLWGLLSCLLRSNGLYVVLPTAVLVLAFVTPRRLSVLSGLCGAAVCAILFSNVLIPALGIRDETASGLYSVCFQQSARVLRDHADTVTAEEYAEIDRVLDAENLPQLYEPWISDPVKYTFRQYGQGAESEKEALARYRATWLSMAKKYPLTYLESFFAGNLSYYTFAPKIEGKTYNNQAGNRLVFETYELGDSRGADPRFVDTTQIAKLEPVRKALALFARGWRHIPVLGMFYVCAVYTWLLVGAAVSAVHQKRFRLLIGFVPALLSLGVCMLGPVNDYFRYFLPIAAMTIPLLAAASKEA